MRYLTLLTLFLISSSAIAQVWEDRQVFGAADHASMLRILSSTDTFYIAPIIEDFVAANPSIAVEYLVTGTAALDTIFRAMPERYDVVISSAMDLQLKLTNDGFATQLENVAHPEWAQWHDSLFAFTSEPAVIVVNQVALRDLSVPESRQDLIQLIRDNPDRFRGKAGTYDIRQSGLGYLFATQDARASETYWRLMEVLGRVDARLYCCSGQMIEDLHNGSLILAYNVLGSYAQRQVETSKELLVIQPSEFPTTMMRTVLASSAATNRAGADRFIRHLLDLQMEDDPEKFPLPPLSMAAAIEGQATINLDPALMTYLDQMKREIFIREWEDAIIQDE